MTAVDSNTKWVGVPAPGVSGVSALPAISGGSELQWTAPASNGLLTATLTAEQAAAASGAVGSVYPQLFVDGVRAPIARVPADPTDFLVWGTAPGNKSGSTTAFGYSAAEVDPASWAPPDDPSAMNDVSALVFDAPWAGTPRVITAVDAAATIVHLGLPARPAPLTNTSFLGVKRWAGLNVQTGPLSQGTYRYRTSTRTLTFASGAIRVTDGATAVSFQGLRFAYTATGRVPPQSSYAAPLQAAVEIGPNATDASFVGCAVTHAGANGIQVSRVT